MDGTPELDKQLAIIKSGANSTVQGFLDWLMEEQGITFCVWSDDHEEFWPDRRQPDRLMADYFGIDLDKIEDERRAILESLRAS